MVCTYVVIYLTYHIVIICTMYTLGLAIGQQRCESFHLDRRFYLVCSEERERERIAYECTSHPSSIKAMK